MIHLETKLILLKERNSGFNDNSHTYIHPFVPRRSHCEPTVSTLCIEPRIIRSDHLRIFLHRISTKRLLMLVNNDPQEGPHCCLSHLLGEMTSHQSQILQYLLENICVQLL
jgi:hypothetical protein